MKDFILIPKQIIDIVLTAQGTFRTVRNFVLIDFVFVGHAISLPVIAEPA
jgi:hypothetical protein